MFDAKDFIFALPQKVAPEAIEGHNTTFHFNIADSGQYSVEVKDGKMNVSEGLNGTPTCKVDISAQNLGKLLSGDLNPMMAMTMGKLKISNIGEMLKYAKIFGLM
jgi:putative sterol carrier protein